MWVIGALVVCWIVVAIALGRREQRLRPTAVDSVERQQRALQALDDATRRLRSGEEHARRAAPGAPARVPAFAAPEPTRSPIRPGVWVVLAGAAAASVLIALVVLGVLGGTGGSKGTRTAARRATPTSTVRRPAKRVAPSTTTSSAPPALTVADQGAEILVRIPNPVFTVRLVAHGDCWVGVLEPPPAGNGGATMHDGDAREIPVLGHLLLRLGQPAAVDVTVGGAPVTLPAVAGQPRNLRFEGGSA